MTNPMENTGPASGTWAWAVQREIDTLQKTMETRYAELSTRIDRVVSGTEYNADKRAAEQQHSVLVERVSNVDKEVEIFKRDFHERIDQLRKEHDADIDKVGLLLDTEKKTRESDRRDDQKELEADREKQDADRLEKKRWLIAAVILPVAIALFTVLQPLLK